jgi:hypothetical protein
MFSLCTRLAVLVLSLAASCAAQLPAITTSALPNGTTGGAYSAALSVTGGTPPYSNWTVGAGSLPPGLKLDPSTGSLSGVPATSGTFTFFVTVADSAGGISPAAAFTITTSAPAVLTLSTDLPPGVVGTAYSYTLTPSGGTPPYSNWTLAAGTLPQGLFLDPISGSITGTPIAVGAYSFKVTVQDSTGVTSQPDSLTIVAGVAIITNSLPKGTLTAAYSAQLAALGGVPPYAGWTVSSGVLPPGLSLAPATGALTGTPTTPGSYSFSITTTDTAGTVSPPQPYTIVIAQVPVVTTGALMSGLPGVPYSATLTVKGGSAPLTWAVTSGSLPVGLSLSPGMGIISGTPQSAAGTTFNFTVQATDSAGVVSAPQPLSLAITLANLTVAPASLSFSAAPGDTLQPPVQSVSIFSVAAPVTFTATPSTTSGGNWLSVRGGGKTPNSILVSVVTGGLTSNTTYKGSIKISGQNIAPATIPVTLTIGATGPATLSVAPSSLTMSYVQGNSTDQRYLVINNTGSGTIHYSSQAATDNCGPNWLNVLSGPGSAIPSTPGIAAILVNPAGISDRTCTGTVTVSDSATGQSQKVPVTMTVSAQNQALLLTRSGMSFQTSTGVAPGAQTFAVLNTGVSTVNWTANAQTLRGGPWLTVSPSTGSATAGVIPSPVTVDANSQGLPPGIYYGSVQIASNSVGNSPQAVSVMLTVLDSPPPPPPLVPSGVILTGQAQSLTIANPWNSGLTYNSTVVTDNGLNWLTQTPSGATVAAGGSATMTLQTNFNGVPPGLAHGVVRIAFFDGTVHSVDVYAIVPPVAVAASGLQPAAVAETCPGNTGIAVVLRSPEPGFQVSAQVPVPLELIARDCATGKVIKQVSGAGAQVIIAGSTSPIPLTDDGTGTWTGTWTPTATASMIELAARVDQYVGSLATVVSGVDYLSGTVNPAPDGAAGVVTAVMNGSTQAAGSATPGSWVSLLGIAMGDSDAAALQTPYPNTLGGTQVLLQGQPLPLYMVNSTQVNALIPSGINVNERQQLVVQRGSTQSPGVDVRVVK